MPSPWYVPPACSERVEGASSAVLTPVLGRVHPAGQKHNSNATATALPDKLLISKRLMLTSEYSPSFVNQAPDEQRTRDGRLESSANHASCRASRVLSGLTVLFLLASQRLERLKRLGSERI